MRKIQGSDLGVADLPMLLMVSAIVTAIAVPIFWSAYEDVSAEMVMGDVLEAADMLFMCSSTVLNGGEGSSMEIELDLTGSGTVSVEEFVIGGPAVGEGFERSLLITFALSNSDTGHLTHSPPLRLSGGSGPVILHGGQYKLRISHEVIGDIHYAGVDLL